MTDKSFRVRLDLTDLRLEKFRHVWVYVSTGELQTIFDFKKHIIRRINLERDVQLQLSLRDGLLLDEETVAILRDDDTVKVKYKIPICQNSKKGSRKESASSSRKRNLSESSVSDEDMNLKRYKPDVILSSNENGCNLIGWKSKKDKRKKQIDSVVNSTNVYCSSEEQKKKRKKSMDSENAGKLTNSLVNFGNSQSTLLEDNQNHKKSSKKKDKKKSIPSNETVTDINFSKTNDFFYSFNTNSVREKQNKSNPFSKPGIGLQSENVSTVVLSNDSYKEDESNFQPNESSAVVIIDIDSKNSDNQPKRKRKRYRKRKDSSANGICCDEIESSKSFSEDVNNSFSGKHIVYLSPDRNENSTCLDDASKICNPSGTYVFHEGKFADVQSQDYPKMSTPAQSNKCDVPDLQLSIMPRKNSGMTQRSNAVGLTPPKKAQSDLLISSCNEGNSKENGKEAIKSTTAQNNIGNKSGKQSYEDLPDITSVPAVGTCIAYKALELDANYSPIVTDYREGIIENINPDTEEIEIKLNKVIILPGKSGKFENLKKDEAPEPTVKTRDVLKWSDIILPKLLSCIPE